MVMKKLTRYKVTVLKNARKRKLPWDDGGEFDHMTGDVIYGYGYNELYEGKYIDLWFTQFKEEDPQNLLTLGRVKMIDNKLFYTNLGKFLMEAIA
jgi:hypothetical protein